MNWITNYVRPKINSLFSRREVPDNLWTKCPECGTMLFHREMAENLNVCTNCQHHMAITPRERFHALFDGGVFTEVKVPDVVIDPLHFRDQKKYPDRLKAAQKASGEREAMLVAEGEIQRTKVVAVAQDFSFMAGSMGMYVGNAIIAAAQTAVKHRRPLVLFSAAGGARMQEGILSLMQMPRTTVAVQMLKEAGLPYIVVLTHPTTGGVTASYSLVHEPDLVVLDEPFQGLDPVNVEMVKNIIRQLQSRGATVILSTHQMNLVEALCDRILLVNRGRAMLYGDLAEIQRQYSGNAVRLRTSSDGLESLPGVARVETHDDTKVLRLANTSPQQLLKTLVEREIPVESFEVATVPLDEIFVAVVKRRGSCVIS